MNEIKVGYARVSTIEQDVSAQRDALVRLGVDEAGIFVDHGITGANRARPACGRRLRRCDVATRSSSQSSIASRGR